MVAPVTARMRILQAFIDRLEEISVDNGYATDAGQTLFLGERPMLGPDDGPAIALVVDEDEPNPAQGLGDGAGVAVTIEWTVSVVALISGVIEAPWLTIERVIGDIKRAMELDDRTLGGEVSGFSRGAVRPLEREEGSTVVGGVVDYLVLYSETWGKPEE